MRLKCLALVLCANASFSGGLAVHPYELPATEAVPEPIGTSGAGVAEFFTSTPPQRFEGFVYSSLGNMFWPASP